MRIRTAPVIFVAIAGISACSAKAPAITSVHGLRDDIKSTKAVAERSHKVKTTSKECTRKVNGKCKSYRTVVAWKKVIDQHAKPALYCVELDNVNGSSKDDDVWYTTSWATYHKAALLAEGDAMKFTPIHGGCW